MSSLFPVTWDQPPRERQLAAAQTYDYPEGHGPSVGIFFGFIAIFVGLVFTWVMAKTTFKKYINLPYTVIVFFFGIIISMVATHASDQSDPMVVSTKIWMNIDPDLMLYALLPPLLFAEAMKLDSHQVRMAFAPAALLALPGAAFGAYMQGLVCFYMLPNYSWDWLFCLMVGAVLSATDPVSVVSMLKSVRGGTTSTVKLTYLITGESLLNDGTALVVFEAIASTHYSTDFSVVMFFVKVLLISPFIGIAMGLISLEILKLARRRLSLEHNTVQIAVTISCAYMSFFVAQYILKVSGIISVCASGIILAWLAPSLYLQPEQLETVWHMLEWVGNTMIFAIAGLIVGKYSSAVTKNDILCIIIIYISMTFLRMLMLSICYPVTKWFHEEYSFKDVIFSTFGGLRGAISLSLVLIMEKHLDDYSDIKSTDYRYFNGTDGRRAMFIICAVVTLTICFNGSFCGSFFIWLYNSRLDNEVDEIIFHYVEKRIRRRAREFISDPNHELPPFDAEEVKQLCSVFSYHYSVAPDSKEAQDHKAAAKTLQDAEAGQATVEFEIDKTTGHEVMVARPSIKVNTNSPGKIEFEQGRQDSNSSIASGVGTNVDFTRFNSNSICKGTLQKFELNDELIMKFRAVFHGITRHCYMRQIQDGRVVRGSAVALALLHASRHGLEMCDSPGLHDWDSIVDTLELFDRERQRLLLIMNKFANWPRIFYFFRNWDEQYERDKVFIITSFLEAHNYAQKILARYLGEKGFVDSPEEQLIVRESTLLMREAQKTLDSIDPNVISFHATEMVARMVLNMADDIVMRFQEEGILNEQDSEDFFKKTNHDMKRIGSLHHRDEYITALKSDNLIAKKLPSMMSSDNFDIVQESYYSGKEGVSSENEKGGDDSPSREEQAARRAKDGWSWSRRRSVNGIEADGTGAPDIAAILSSDDSASSPVADKDSPSPPIDESAGSPKLHTKHGLYSSDGQGRLSLHVDSASMKKYAALRGDDDDNNNDTEMVNVSDIDVKADINKVDL